MAEGERSAVEQAEILRIASLANLDLTEEELARMTTELDRILVYVRQLQELDLTDVPPTAHVQIESAPLRDDVPQPSLPRELALREAPKVSEDGFAVPAFVDEG
jgi:aspartyl-tRNA(Asn)/glutamyl-tRNA(Gln) amidotransferase subunit C